MSDSDDENQVGLELCKGCNDTFSCLIQHLRRRKETCKQKYTEAEISYLRKQSGHISDY